MADSWADLWVLLAAKKVGLWVAPMVAMLAEMKVGIYTRCYRQLRALVNYDNLAPHIHCCHFQCELLG